MRLFRLFRPSAQQQAAYRLYGAIVAAARDPAFFLRGGVPDTLDGRFELIALHVVLVLRRLAREHGATKAFAQELFDAMFADLDRALRELGAGDLGVGRQVKHMVAAFYGRARSYERMLAGEGEEAAEILRRNLFGTAMPVAPEVDRLIGYVRSSAAALDEQQTAELLAGSVRFPALPV